MLKRLLKKQLLELFQSYFYDAKKNRARSKVATILYFAMFALLMAGLLGGIFTVLAMSMCTRLVSAGMGWLYFALMGLIAVFLGAFGSVFNTYAGLYLPKDNDLLLSMPIPASTLICARLLGVYLMGLLYSSVVILPTVIVYWIMADASIPAILGGLLLMLLISVFVLTLSFTLGWVVAKISQKLKRRSLITVLASLAFIGGYYFVYFKAQSMLQDLLANAAVYGARIRQSAYPLYLFGSVGVGDGMAALIVTAAVAVLFGLMWLLLSRSFLRIATSGGKIDRKAYRKTAVRQRSVDGALLRREFSRFAASPNYILNCGLGTFLIPLCAVAVLWKGSSLFALMNEMFAEVPGGTLLLLCVLLCALASMNLITAPSVSLEGKSLWLMQSLPVESWKVFRAKVRMQLILTVPSMLLCVVCVAVVYPLKPIQLILMLLLVASYGLLAALSGLTLGVKLPTLSWTNEVLPLKQGAPVTLALFGGWGYTLLLFAGFLLLPGWKLGFPGYVGCFIVLNGLLCAWNCLWLRKKGAARFAAL